MTEKNIANDLSTADGRFHWSPPNYEKQSDITRHNMHGQDDPSPVVKAQNHRAPSASLQEKRKKRLLHD